MKYIAVLVLLLSCYIHPLSSRSVAAISPPVIKESIGFTIPASSIAPQPVVTWGYSFRRNNVNAREYVLTPSNVGLSTFGKLFAYSVDGYIYGQPLFVPNLTVNGATHNVIYVATENDSVYAFDADGGGMLWKRSFGLAIPCANVSGCLVAPSIGITATPVIDLSLNSIYVTSRQFDPSTAMYSHHLHALNLLTGAENPGSPVRVTGSVSGSGYDAQNGIITFNPVTASDRSALLELNGIIYIGYASFGDTDPYHGWIFGFSASSLKRTAIANVTPNGQRSGIWGAPLASDGTYVYVATGNGSWDGAQDFGNSYLKFSRGNGGFSLTDFFTPFNVSALTTDDNDLGSAMATLLPTLGSSPFPHIMIGAGKEGRIYVVDRDLMGHYNSGCDCQIVQSIPNAVGVHTTRGSDLERNFGTPPYWNGNVYFSGTDDHIKQFHLNTTTSLLDTTPVDQTSTTYASPGSNPVVSSNGNSNGILWAVEKGGNVLHAYDAAQVSKELYNSAQDPTRDGLGSSIKFAPPLVINGKVYVGTRNQLVAYGIL